MLLKSFTAATLLGVTAFASPAFAGTILIVNGASNTSEPNTTSSITTQLSNLEVGVGNTVTVVDTTPIDISNYSQVWDIRFSNSSPITSAVQSQYVTYLQNGGGMFAMGENSNFTTRNSSVISLIAAAGGGSLTFTTPGDSQTVYAPFTGPTPVTSIGYYAAGGVTTFGTGQWISANATGGSGVAFAKGTLANAQNGSLTALFDVNFMQTDAPSDQAALLKNLVGFVGAQVSPPAVPEPATWGMMILGFGAVGAAMRRRRKVIVRYAA